MRQSACHSCFCHPRHLRAGILAAILCAGAPAAAQTASTLYDDADEAQSVATSETSGGLCPPASHAPLPRVEGDPDDPRTHIEADSADISLETVSVFRGAVAVRRGLRQLNADRVDYDRQQDTAHAEGNVRLLQNDLLITGAEADLDMAAGTGQVSQATYRTAENQQGRAETIRILDKYRTELDDATYTTCDIGDPDWLLSAGHIMLDNENRQGSASNVVVRFKGVPFLYLPYMRFPIGDERLSGLLYPSIGDSDQHGTRVVVPYYWNIAPQMDATLTLDHMSRRGTMLQTEFRYLTANNEGQLDWHYLPDDKIYGEDRERVRWQHEGRADAGWSGQVEYNSVADTDHLFDFGDDLNATSTTHLQRRGQLVYNADRWQFTSLAQSHQVINGNETYQRLPQLGLTSRLPQRDNALNYHLDAQWVAFAHRDAPTVPEGNRLAVEPSISLPLRAVYGFAEPRLSLHYTQYDLDPATTPSEPEQTRTVPIFSLNSGLFFERDTRIGETDLLHTLEPQLFYAYIPYRDQSAIPVFDSAFRRFNINDPFRANRFDGVDRIGDTNHLTAALTTRLLGQQTGQELLMARLAQVFYFEDRRVTLGNDALDDSRRSDIIGEFDLRPNNRWAFDSDVTWSPQDDEVTVGNARLRYSPWDSLSLAAAYRFQRDRLETSEAGFDWRLNPRWGFHGRRLYDLENRRELESVLGLRYDSCCWGLSLEAGKRFVSSDRPEENTLLLILELKGLASFGE
ncbi:LPS-assembly protein LptD [Thiohalophilus sp.]|uniref:LPS-assembly protein LptD n=1 Tax=Thiohalophilus sp. TaxID=3028392 RepID=UPI002ACD292B|nr:LPS-assembly protein LptD [Thiohalophilus sp.]MDZ7803884.1 LPS-assembly protein LptD [Thiohalophilus sp.]